MRFFDYVLAIFGGFVIFEASAIIALNTKRGFWEKINKLHVLSAVSYLIYLCTVIYSSLNCDRASYYCDLLWKTCNTLYILVTMFVYFFYWVKSRVVNTTSWNGKKLYERVALVMIVMIAVMSLGFFWFPMKDIQFKAFLIDGECYLPDRR